MASSKDTTWAVKAKAVFICNACGLWHEVRYDPVAKRDLPPPACAKCGRMDFTHFHSKTEAKRTTDDATYEFAGTKTDQIKQIGNAVSVAMMKAEVRAIMADAAVDARLREAAE